MPVLITSLLYGNGKEPVTCLTLFQVIDNFTGRLCAELRDRIYALLGVSLPLAVSVDSEKPLPNVFVEAARAMICQQENIIVICMVPFNEEEVSKQMDLIFQAGCLTLN
jgi:hypothetical protein